MTVDEQLLQQYETVMALRDVSKQLLGFMPWCILCTLFIWGVWEIISADHPRLSDWVYEHPIKKWATFTALFSVAVIAAIALDHYIPDMFRIPDDFLQLPPLTR